MAFIKHYGILFLAISFAGCASPPKPGVSSSCTQEKLFSYSAFDAEKDQLSKRYDKKAGARVMASMGRGKVDQPAGNYPWLTEEMARMGLAAAGDPSLSRKPVCAWPALSGEVRHAQLQAYLVATKASPVLAERIDKCLSRFSASDAAHSQVPSIGQVAVVCVMKEGVGLPK